MTSPFLNGEFGFCGSQTFLVASVNSIIVTVSHGLLGSSANRLASKLGAGKRAQAMAAAAKALITMTDKATSAYLPAADGFLTCSGIKLSWHFRQVRADSNVFSPQRG